MGPWGQTLCAVMVGGLGLWGGCPAPGSGPVRPDGLGGRPVALRDRPPAAHLDLHVKWKQRLDAEHVIGGSGQLTLALDRRWVLREGPTHLVAHDLATGKPVARFKKIGRCEGLPVTDLHLTPKRVLLVCEHRDEREVARRRARAETTATLQCLDRVSGRLVWERRGLEPVPLAVGAGLVAAVSPKGLLGLAVATGKQRWTAADAGPDKRPLLLADRVVVADALGEVQAIDRRRARRLWKLKLAGRPAAALAGDSQRVYSLRELSAAAGGAQKSEIVALSVASGAILWRRPVAGEFAAAAVVGAGTVYALTLGDSVRSGKLLAFDAASGRSRFAVANMVSDVIHDYRPTLWGDQVLLWSENSGRPRLTGRQGASGQLLWTHRWLRAEKTQLSRPRIAGSLVLFGDGHWLYALQHRPGAPANPPPRKK